MTIEFTLAQLVNLQRIKPSSLKTKARARRGIAMFSVKIVTRKAIPRLNVRQRKEVKRGSLK